MRSYVMFKPYVFLATLGWMVIGPLALSRSCATSCCWLAAEGRETTSSR